jgi:hypothetical protein
MDLIIATPATSKPAATLYRDMDPVATTLLLVFYRKIKLDPPACIRSTKEGIV